MLFYYLFTSECCVVTYQKIKPHILEKPATLLPLMASVGGNDKFDVMLCGMLLCYRGPTFNCIKTVL